MELDLQSLFGLHVLRNSPRPAFGLIYDGAIGLSQDRRHLFLTPWSTLTLSFWFQSFLYSALYCCAVYPPHTYDFCYFSRTIPIYSTILSYPPLSLLPLLSQSFFTVPSFLPFVRYLSLILFSYSLSTSGFHHQFSKPNMFTSIVIEPTLEQSEPVFLNVYGAQESIPRNEFRQPM
jgi:hypothetical protein